MGIDWSNGALSEGLKCYQKQEFFEAHEFWEVVWLQCNEPQKTFLQALIQLTAAFHHLQRGNLAGATSLLRRSLKKLDAYPSEFEGVAVGELRESIRAWLEALQKESGANQLSFPRIGS